MRIKFSLFVYLFFFLLVSENVFSKINNQIILKVENEIITNYEIKNKILRSLFLANQEVSQENINKIKKQSLENLIQFKIKKIEVEKYKISKDVNQVNSYLESISSKDLNQFKKKFKDANLDFTLFLDEIETESKWQKLIYKIYSSKIKIDEGAINKDLNSIIVRQKEIKEFKISEIEVSLDSNSNGNKIADIKNQIKKEGFESTAIKISISQTANNKGQLGWLNAKALSKDIFEAINGLKIGEIANPIKRQNSLLFLKLNDVRVVKPKNIDIDKLKRDLINQKKNELFNLYSRSHLSKLKNTSLIEYQ